MTWAKKGLACFDGFDYEPIFGKEAQRCGFLTTDGFAKDLLATKLKSPSAVKRTIDNICLELQTLEEQLSDDAMPGNRSG